MIGGWIRCSLVFTLLLAIRGARGQEGTLAGRLSDFQTFVLDFQNSYAYRDRPDQPWLTWETRYRGAVQQADSKNAFSLVLASALSELHDFHAEVRSHVPDRWLPVPTFADLWAELDGSDAVVTAVRQGSDAERAGVRVGDQIVSVDGVALERALADRLTPQAGSTDSAARQWALLSVLTGRAEQARVLVLKDRAGTLRTITLPVERRFDRPAGALSFRTLPGNLGLIRFHNSLGEQGTVTAFDAALLQLQGTKGLLLDLRDVPSGGDSAVALGIMGRFITTMLPFQRHRIPHYGQADVERNWIEMVTPRGPFVYNAPVVVLVNHWTGSMGEGMAIGFDAMHRATVVGTPMAHLAGAVSDEKLPNTGADVAYPTEQIFHINGTPRQNWLPPILVKMPLGSHRDDDILQRGVAALTVPTP